MRESFSSSEGFVLLEALFCLVLVAFAFGIFGFYLSLPKVNYLNQSLIFPAQIVSREPLKLHSHGLDFDVRIKKLQEGESVYFSFEALL